MAYKIRVMIGSVIRKMFYKEVTLEDSSLELRRIMVVRLEVMEVEKRYMQNIKSNKMD